MTFQCRIFSRFMVFLTVTWTAIIAQEHLPDTRQCIQLVEDKEIRLCNTVTAKLPCLRSPEHGEWFALSFREADTPGDYDFVVMNSHNEGHAYAWQYPDDVRWCSKALEAIHWFSFPSGACLSVIATAVQGEFDSETVHSVVPKGSVRGSVVSRSVAAVSLVLVLAGWAFRLLRSRQSSAMDASDGYELACIEEEGYASAPN